MNVLIYIPELNQQWGGIRQYAVGLIKTLAGDAENRYFIYHNSGDDEVLNILRAFSNLKHIKDDDVKPSVKDHFKNKAKGFRNRTVQFLGVGKIISRPTLIDLLCIKYHIDIIHCPYQFIPHTKRAKLITTLHDVQEIHFPENFTAEERAGRANAHLDFVTRADAVVVSYNHIKEDLVRYFQVENTKVHVILLNMDKLWFDQYAGGLVGNDLPGGLPEKYLLYPANTWKHKNHIALLEAIAMLKKEEGLVINLVCTGYITEDHGIRVLEKMDELMLNSQVNFLGIVNEKVLYSLYKNALGVVVPTMYEAGSFPLMESMLLGVPVICSNVTSLPETIGDDDFIFCPRDVHSIKAKLKQIWTDENFRKRSIDNSLIQSKVLRQSNALEKILKVYNNI